MYIQLEQQDYNEIAVAISQADDTQDGYIEYEDIIDVRFKKFTEWKSDNDYYDGTGTATVVDVDFELKEIIAPCEVRYNHCKLSETIEKELWIE